MKYSTVAVVSCCSIVVYTTVDYKWKKIDVRYKCGMVLYLYNIFSCCVVVVVVLIILGSTAVVR